MMKVTFAALLLIGIGAATQVEVPENYYELVRMVFGEPPKVHANVRDRRQVQTSDQLEWENSVCECVPYYQCNFNGTMNENGEGIIDIRTGPVGAEDNPASARRACDHYLSVCCLPPEIVPGRDVNPGQDGSGGQDGGQDGEQDDQNGKVEPIPPPQGGSGGQDGQGDQDGQGGPHTKPHVNRGCGYRNANGIGFRITGAFNNEANFAEFPWMVAVLSEKDVQGNLVKVYQGGGSLIHKRVVLTAAHRVHGLSASQLSIRAGEWDTQTTDEPLPHQDRDVAIVAVHPEYHNGALYNDYALLILTKPVDLADNVEVVCLPDPNEAYDHDKCFATGWGKDKFGEEGQYQVILKAVELSIVPRDRCQNDLRKTRLGSYFNLHKSFICAGGNNQKDTCTGDGGSPLVCPLSGDPNRYTQAGIVAWGIGCGEENTPGVYAHVAMARKWIDDTLASYHIDTISYSPGGNNNYPPVVPPQTGGL